jgi:hypothetical protein
VFGTLSAARPKASEPRRVMIAIHHSLDMTDWAAATFQVEPDKVVEMEIPKDQILDLLRQRGENDTAGAG